MIKAISLFFWLAVAMALNEGSGGVFPSGDISVKNLPEFLCYGGAR
jgi:hypothetical protein